MATTFTRIVATLDGSPLGERVLPYLAPLATRFEGTVTLLRVVEPVGAVAAVLDAAAGGASGNPLVHTRRPPADAEAEAKEYLESIAHDLRRHGIRVQTVVRTGSAASVIVEEAQREGADLVMLATHGRGGVVRTMVGSIADAVVRHATCPVLLIPVR